MKTSKYLRYWEAIIIGQLAGIFVHFLGGWPAFGYSVSAFVSVYFAAHFVKEADHWETSKLYDGDGNTVYIHRHRGCNYESRSYKEHGTPYCPNCGARMDAKEEQ